MNKVSKNSFLNAKGGERGYVYDLFSTVELYRMMNTLPIYGILVDVYFPKDTRGSVSGLKTTDLKYEDIPDIKNLKVLITNLDNYSNGDTVYESFEKDEYWLKTIHKGEPLHIPRSSKIVLQGTDKVFVSKDSLSLKPVNEGIVAYKVELTPMHLSTDGKELLDRLNDLVKKESFGEIIPDYVDEVEAVTKKISEAEIDFEDNEDLIEIESLGDLINE